MSIGLSEFWTRLVRQEILDATACNTLALDFAKASGGKPPNDASELSRFLVMNGTLTPFQARTLLADSPTDLRLGTFRMRSDSAPSPMTRWVEVSRKDAQGSLLLTTTGNAWLEAHARVQFPSLQPIETESIGEHIGVFSQLPVGRSLEQLLQESKVPFNSQRVCEIGIALTGALSALHGSTLLHGSIRADRVWMGDAGEVILLRDPAGPAVTGLGDASGQWLDVVEAPESYIAPELALPSETNTSRSCTGASDIYSLGCLLFRLLAGRRPFESGSTTETLNAHLTESPTELVNALEQGESGDPMYRILAYAMAKDPGGRFATAEQLGSALRAVLPILLAPQRSKHATAPKPATTQPKQQSLPVQKEVQTNPGAAERPPAKQKLPVKQSDPKTTSPDKQKRQSDAPAPVQASETVKADSAQKNADSVQEPEPTPDSQPDPEQPPIEQTAPTPTEKPTSEPVPEREREPEPEPEPPEPEPEPARVFRRRRKRKSKAPLVLTALTVVVLMLLIALLVTDPTQPIAEKKQRRPMPTYIPPVSNGSRSNSEPATDAPPRKNPSLANSAPSGATNDLGGYDVVADERLLFAPPYLPKSPNPPLSLLPPGPSALVTVRLNSVLRSQAGKDMLSALSPELSELLDAAVARAGVAVNTIDRLTVGLVPGDQGRPSVSLAIELSEPQSLDALIERWEVGASQTREGGTVYAGDAADGDVFFLPPDQVESKLITRYAVGSLDRISELAAIEGEPIQLARSLETLWNNASEEADLVALMPPNFLFADGRTLLDRSVPELTGKLRSVLIPDVAAMLITAKTVDEQVFCELRFAPSGGISQAMLMRNLRDSIAAWPNWADQFVIEASPDPSWRLLASRLPVMIRFVAESFRFGISDDAVVANTYLPERAFSQVTLATILAANTPSSGGSPAGTTMAAAPLTIDEMLSRKMSVAFDQESLEFAIDVIVEEFVRKLPDGSSLPPVRIVGSDLQKMGITQNQQVRKFTKTDIPLRTVLTDLVVGANPDKTATGPNDPKQALVWVVTDDPESPDKKVILVTTRQAAAGKYDLPSEFQSAQ